MFTVFSRTTNFFGSGSPNFTSTWKIYTDFFTNTSKQTYFVDSIGIKLISPHNFAILHAVWPSEDKRQSIILNMTSGKSHQVGSRLDVSGYVRYMFLFSTPLKQLFGTFHYPMKCKRLWNVVKDLQRELFT